MAVIIEQRGAVVEVGLDNGDANLLTIQACDELTALLTAPPADAHVVHLRAQGPNFCLGRERGADDVDGLDESTIGGVGSYVGSGGMRTKVGSARVAVRSATHAVIADARRPDVLAEVIDENWDPPVTLGVRLVSVIDDDTQHIGQAAYVRGLLS